MNETVVRTRVDPELKSDADQILSELGLSTTEAIRMFLAQVRLRRGLPFSVALPNDNEDILMTPAMRQSAIDAVYDD